MADVKFLFAQEDGEMLDELQKRFGQGQLEEERDFIGAIIIIYVVPVATLTVEICNFIFSHVIESKKDKQAEIASKRKVEINGKRVSLYGYSPEEVIKICESLGLTK